MKTKLILLFALTLALCSCQENGDEPWNTSAKDVTIIALCTDYFNANTIFTMSTADGQIKSTKIVESNDNFRQVFYYNGQVWIWSKSNDGYNMLRYDNGSINERKHISFLDNYLGDDWFIMFKPFSSNYYFNCLNNTEKKNIVFDMNGISKQYTLINPEDYKEEDGSFSLRSFYEVDESGNYYYVYHINGEGPWYVEKNGQNLYEATGLIVEQICMVDHNLYLLGTTTNGQGAYWVNGKIVVDNYLSSINSACALNGKLCLGGYVIDEHNVRKAAMMVGNKYYDLTAELDWDGYVDQETGQGKNNYSSVVNMIVENNEIYSVVSKFNPVNTFVAGGEGYLKEYGNAIFKNEHKIMDFGDKSITSFVVIPQ